MDVSSYQANVDWSAAAANGAQFAYVKASEGTGYLNPYFRPQYSGAYGAGMVRGAYHFALPNQANGAAQANYFVDNGGGWSPDGRTLPPMLDIEYNPYAGNTCYDLNPGQMSSWIADFSTTVYKRIGRYPMIYTTTSWWNLCTGANPNFGATNPLFIARYSTSPGPLPAGWGVSDSMAVTEPAAAGFVTVWAGGAPRPTASNLNFVAGQTVPNLVVAPVGADGKIQLYNSAGGSTELVADVAGYYLQ